jgi:hypothetical protein
MAILQIPPLERPFSDLSGCLKDIAAITVAGSFADEVLYESLCSHTSQSGTCQPCAVVQRMLGLKDPSEASRPLSAVGGQKEKATSHGSNKIANHQIDEPDHKGTAVLLADADSCEITPSSEDVPNPRRFARQPSSWSQYAKRSSTGPKLLEYQQLYLPEVPQPAVQVSPLREEASSSEHTGALTSGLHFIRSCGRPPSRKQAAKSCASHVNPSKNNRCGVISTEPIRVLETIYGVGGSRPSSRPSSRCSIR